MYISEFFKEDYKLLKPTDNQREVISAFLEDAEAEKVPEYFKPLTEVFIHKTNNEMYLILDCMNFSNEYIKKICEDCEDKVLYFVNFGKEYREHIHYLKYNISLIILYNDEESVIDDNFRYETEKSLKICRKIFLCCDKEGKVKENDKTIIPFYFAPVEKMDAKETDELEKDIKKLLPNDNDEILSICKKEKLIPEDINIMCGWLMKNDNN